MNREHYKRDNAKFSVWDFQLTFVSYTKCYFWCQVSVTPRPIQIGRLISSSVNIMGFYFLMQSTRLCVEQWSGNLVFIQSLSLFCLSSVNVCQNMPFWKWSQLILSIHMKFVLYNPWQTSSIQENLEPFLFISIKTSCPSVEIPIGKAPQQYSPPKIFPRPSPQNHEIQ